MDPVGTQNIALPGFYSESDFKFSGSVTNDMRVIDSAFSDKVIDNGTDHGFWQNGNQTIVLETISGDTFSIQKVTFPRF